MMSFSRLFSALALCILCFSTACPAEAQQQEWFQRVFLQGTDGHVGQHMSMSYAAYESDYPARCRTGNLSNWFAHTWSYTGELPPGIEYHEPPDNGYPFTGTPRQAGVWNVQLEFEVGCTPLVEPEHWRRRINVTIRIEP